MVLFQCCKEIFIINSRKLRLMLYGIFHKTTYMEHSMLNVTVVSCQCDPFIEVIFSMSTVEDVQRTLQDLVLVTYDC